MRIAYITESRELGGAERHLVDLAGGMVQAGHETVVLAPQAELVEFVAREAPGVRVERAFSDAFHDTPGKAARAAALARELRSMVSRLRRLRPDVLHVNNGGWPGSDLAMLAPLAARLAGVPRRIITAHSTPWPRSGREQVLADQAAWTSVHAVICPTHAVARGLTERRGMPPRLKHLLRYGVAAPPSGGGASEVREDLGGDGTLLAGMVSARPVPEKGYDVFLEALDMAGPGVRGVLVGRAPAEFEQRAKDLDGRLRLVGLQPRLGDYYRALDVLVVPSTAEECMPLVILEAAACGTATVGSRLSGLPEAIVEGETGLLFEPGDGAALSGLLRDLAGERGRAAALGAAARDRWEQTFTLERMLTEHERLYSGRLATQL